MTEQQTKVLASGWTVLWLFLAFIAALIPTGALASPLALGPDIPYTSMADKSQQHTVEQAYTQLSRAEETHTKIFSRGYTRTPYWLHFSLPARLFEGDERWVVLAPNFIDDIRLFYRPAGSQQGWVERRTGDTWKGKRGDVDYRFPVFRLPPPKDAQGYEVILRAASTSALLIDLKLWEPHLFLQHATRTTSFWAFYFGLAAISSLLALILAILLKSKKLWSITAVSAGYGLVACVQGYIGWLLPGVGLTLQHYLTSIFTLTSYAALLWMSSEVMHFKEKLPWAHKLMTGTAALIIMLLISVPLNLYDEAIYIQTVIYLFTGIIFLVSCLYIWWKEKFQLTNLILGISPLLIMLASLSGLMSMLTWLPYHPSIYTIWQYGLILNMLLVISTAVFQVYKQRIEELNKKKMVEELHFEKEARAHQRQFMGIVAHEFRTPLAIITASLANLRYLPSLNRQETLRYEKIERATERLVQLTDNCLADARLSAGQLLIETQPHSLVELITSAASLIPLSDHHSWKLTQDNQHIQENSPPKADAILEIDPALMRIALSNVIDNAVKYSPSGIIHIDLSRQHNHWVISVRDQGTGIPADRVAIIFERYRRASLDDESTRGVGLGLYVSRQIARAHGGELELAENASSGCRFTFILPLTSNNNQDI
ncbi:sensor histidine kinase [Vreelandella maris]|uniref:histidine kinase n=1 Tax=Vreelandella maris TaxID=2729617 RepID=A0A7Y6RAP4_9GAMM|nr:ATP-binding protein [Halomonas maris]NVF13459.1 histidine kinase [Halomonas maris]